MPGLEETNVNNVVDTISFRTCNTLQTQAQCTVSIQAATSSVCASTRSGTSWRAYSQSASILRLCGGDAESIDHLMSLSETSLAASAGLLSCRDCLAMLKR